MNRRKSSRAVSSVVWGCLRKSRAYLRDALALPIELAWRSAYIAQTRSWVATERFPDCEPLESRRLLAGIPGFTGVPEWAQPSEPELDNKNTQIPDEGNPVSGAVNAIAAHPTNPNILFVATVNGGIWVTGDALDTDKYSASPAWTPLTDRYPSSSFGDIAFDPTDPASKTIWAGYARTSNGNGDGEILDGLLRTTNNGATWTRLAFAATGFGAGAGGLQGVNISSVVPTTQIDPTTNQQVILIASNSGGVYRSNDGGTTFRNLTATAAAGLPVGAISSQLIVDPGNPNQFYAAIPNQGVFRSTNNQGATWAPFNTGLAFAGSVNINLSIFNGGGTNAVYAAVVGPVQIPGSNPPQFLSQLTGVFRSSGGGNWAAIGTAPNTHPGGQGNNLSFIADRTNANVVYVAGDRAGPGNSAGIFRGDASTNTWTQITGGGANNTSPHADSRDMAWDANGNLLESDDGGIYRLLNVGTGSQKWHGVVGSLEAHESRSVAYIPGAGFASGNQDTGTPIPQIPNPQQSTFTYQDFTSADGGAVAVDSTSTAGSNILYHSQQQFGGFSRSSFTKLYALQGTTGIGLKINNTAAGVTLSKQIGSTNPPTFAFDNTIQFIQPYVLNAINPKQMLIGTSFLYESTDQGDDLTSLGGFNNLNSDGNDNDGDGATDEGDEFTAAGAIGRVSAMVYGGGTGANANAAVIYAASDILNAAGTVIGSNLFLRQSGVGAPTAITSPAPAAGIRDIVLDPDNWRIAYVAAGNGRIYTTPDATATPIVWNDITGDLTTAPTPASNPNNTDLRTIEFYRDNITKMLFVGGAGGVYFVQNPGTASTHWREFGNFLPNMLVKDLHYDYSANLLYAGTWGRGVWGISSVKQYFSNKPTELKVVGDIEGQDQSDIITLKADPNIPGLLRISVVGGGKTHNYSIEAGSLDTIDLTGGGGANDVYNIEDLPAGIVLNIDVGTANALVSIGKAGVGIRTTVLGTVVIKGGAGASTRLVVDDQSDPGNNATVNVSSNAFGGAISGLAGGTINYDGTAKINAISIWTSQGGANTVNIFSTNVPTSINQNRINNPALASTINIGISGQVTGITGPITIEDSGVFDVINIGDSGDNGTAAIVLDEFTPGGSTPFGRFTGPAPAPISFKMASTRIVTLQTGFAANAALVNGDGTLGGQNSVVVNKQPNVTVKNMVLPGGLTANIAPNFQALNNVAGDTLIAGGTGAKLDNNILANLTINANAGNVLATHNTIAGNVVVNGGAANVTFNNINTIVGSLTATGTAGLVADLNNIGTVSLTNTSGASLTNNTVIGAVALAGDTNPILDKNKMASLTLTNTTGAMVKNNTVTGAVLLDGGSNALLDKNSMASLTLTGATNSPIVTNNKIVGALTINGAGATNVNINNNVMGSLKLVVPASGRIRKNNIGGVVVPGRPEAVAAIAVDILATFNGLIDDNDIHDSTTGVNYTLGAQLIGNRIFNNTTGVIMPVNNTADGLGFSPGSGANDIYNNITGVNLTGRMQVQHIYANVTGVIGSGILGPDALNTANLIESNTTGVDFTGTIQFNRIYKNATGVLAHTGNVAIHNLIYRNTGAGIKTAGANDVRIYDNTFYMTAGNGVQVDGGSARIELLNNIFQADGGTDVFVADDSRVGFFSDYNDLYSTGTGRVFHYAGDFSDILDLQADIGLFDLHSIGTSAVNPGYAAPRFANLAADDYQIAPLTTGQHASSPTVDAGDPLIDLMLPASYVNLLGNPSFESGVTSWSTNIGGTTQSGNPPAFHGSSYFFAGGVAAGFAQQTLSLTAAGFTAQQLDAQNLNVVFGGRIRSAAEASPDQGKFIVSFLDGANNALGAADTVPASNASDRWELVGDRVHVPVGARSVVYRFESTRQSGGTDDSYLDGAFVYVLPQGTAPDQGAFSNTVVDSDIATAHIQLTTPQLYVDWELTKPHTIFWSTFNAGGSPIKIDLYQDVGGVPQFLKAIAASAPDTGSFSWIPQNFGLTYGTFGLRIAVSLVSNGAVNDRSNETFTIPENVHTYYVNDASTVGDQYSTAAGDNRNTGRLASSPKPLLSTILDAYPIGAGDTIFVDTGVYQNLLGTILSGNPAIGGQGVTIIGPTNAGAVAQIISPSNAPVFEVNAANNVTLTHLTLQGGTYGVWVHNGSSGFTGTFLTASGNSLDGIRLDADSSGGATLDHLTAFQNGRDGVSIGGPGVNLANTLAHDNVNGAGIRFDNSGAINVTADEAYANKYGLAITNGFGSPTATIGDADLTKNLGNKFHDNSVNGIAASGPITVVGNTVYDTGAPGGPGPAQVTLTAGASGSLNSGTYTYRVSANTPAGETLSSQPQSYTLPAGKTGINVTWALVPGATSYNVYRNTAGNPERLIAQNVTGPSYLDNSNSNLGANFSGYGTVGINLTNGATASQNVVYSNYYGIYSSGGAVNNNRVFNNAGYGIYGANANASGNVIYSNYVGLEGDSSPVWSDNLIYANSGGGGIWLHSGFSASILNNTIFQLSGDGVRIESSGGNFGFQHVQVRNNIVWIQSGYGITVTPQAEINFASDFNDFYTTGTGQVGFWEGVARQSLSDWHLASFTDSNSISQDPKFVNLAGPDGLLGFANFADHGTDDDFHEQSTAGSFHGGALAPKLNAVTGLPTAVAGTLTSDAGLSPAVDRGDASSSFSNETSPNGGFINLGAYGNTLQASKSPDPYVLVLSPNGGEALVEGQTFNITWRSEDSAGTANIDLLNGNSVVLNIASSVPNNGQFAWIIPNSITSGSNYFIRVTRTGPPTATDKSDSAISIAAATHNFYVNDATFQAGDFTTAAGNDNNSGLDPAHPKASIRALLDAYNLTAGDIINVDAGTYTFSSNIIIPASRSGVTIKGFFDPQNASRISLINRNNTTIGSVVFDLQGADNITLDHLSITGGDIGVYVGDNVGATGLTITNSDIYGNYDFNIYIGNTNGGAVIDKNQIRDISAAFGTQAYGLFSKQNQITVTNNLVFGNPREGIHVEGGSANTITGNIAHHNGVGISADSSNVSGNIAHDNTTAGFNIGGGSVVTGNTAFNNTGGNPAAGFQVFGGTVQGNIAYGNAYGLTTATGQFGTATIANNRLYTNTTAGMSIGDGATVSGNVIYANPWGILANIYYGTITAVSNNILYGNTAGGLQLVGGYNTTISNNTIYQTAGNAFELYPIGGQSSVNVQVRNNILWSTSGYDLRIDPSSQGGVTSDYNDLYATGTGKIGLWQNVDRNTLAAWQLASLGDANSLSADPLFVDLNNADFHEQSLFGSFHGGSLAPVLNAATGLPVAVTSTLTNDAKQSPVIDRGSAADPFANEPAPNGGYINIGAYGNSAQASRSPSTYMLVTRPNGGENWVGGQQFNITWRNDNPGVGQANIDLMHQAPGGALTLQANIATNATNNGQFAWTIPAAIPTASDYVIRVTRQGSGTTDISDATFSISAATHTYYINDAFVQPGDFTTAPGDDLNNSGLDPAHPKASLPALFGAYQLSAADTIKIDRGTYTFNGDIVFTAQQSGIKIIGFTGSDQSANWNASVLASGPASYYRFGDASGTTAVDSINASGNATYVNGVTLGQPGALANDANTAASFDGVDDYVKLPNGFGTIANGFSFEAWVYPTAANYYSMFFDLGNGQQNDNVVFARQGTSQNLYLGIVKGSSDAGSVIANGVLTLNEWQHIAVSMDNSGAVNIYRNGTVVASGNVTLPNNVVRTSNFIGHSNFSNVANYAGRIDEAVFYTKVLAPAEIQARYQLALRQTILDRGNVGGSAFNFQGADDVTISNLKFTRGDIGIFANYNADSDRISILNCEFAYIDGYGIVAHNANDNWTIANNSIHDVGGPGRGAGGIVIDGNNGSLLGPSIHDNIVHNNYGTGISVSSIAGSLVENNQSYNNSIYGFYIDTGILQNNIAHDNGGFGITVSSGGLALNNEVYNQLNTNVYGIYLYAGEARGNNVHDNFSGIGAGYALIDNNRVYHNLSTGIYAPSSTTASGNVVYSNTYGIVGDNAPNVAARGPYYYNNLVYANTQQGIWLRGGADAQIFGNTVYQPAGVGVQIDGGSGLGSYNVQIKNNIVWAQNGYDLAVSEDSAPLFQSDYNDLYVTGNGKVGRWANTDFPTLDSWKYEWGLDTHSLSSDPQFVNPAGADGILGYPTGAPANGGLDDDFHVKPGSPTIDAGDPSSPFIAEPTPNGGRVNLGNYGNTPGATASNAQTIEVISPWGFEKLEAGHVYNVNWHTSGLTPSQIIAQFNTGGGAVAGWSAGNYQVGGVFSGSIGNAIDLSSVSNPAPQAVYQSFTYDSHGIGNSLAYQIPIANGAYTIRLHWEEPSETVVGNRKFDISLQGAVVQSDFDVFAAAGNARFKATTLSFPVNATGGNGISLQLTNKTPDEAFLCAIEIFATNPGGVATSAANVQLSTDSGAHWNTIATSQPIDAYGNGSFAWTAGPQTTGNTALIRVISNNPGNATGTSQPFAIYNGGPDYYVNDSSQAGDLLTTAIGNNANSGKSPDQPLADIQTVLSQYNPGAGAVIHVDTGTYVLIHNINLTAANAGLKIQGPTGAAAVLNRNNLGAVVFDFGNGANNITLDHLAMTSSVQAVNANYGANSNNVTISNNDFYANVGYGVFLGTGNLDWLVTGNKFHDQTGAFSYRGIGISSVSRITVTNNIAFNNPGTGISVDAAGSIVSGNTSYGNGTGIYGGSALVVGNTVYGNGTGIFGDHNDGVVRGNFVYNNTVGIDTGAFSGSPAVEANTVFNNTSVGIKAHGGAAIRRNKVYSNKVGIFAEFSIFSGYSGPIEDNLIYGNTNQGIYLTSSGGVRILNNTVYQSSGQAVRIEGSSNTFLRSNILWVDAGASLYVAPNSQSGFTSDYNLLYTGTFGQGNIGFFNNANQSSLAAWQTATAQDAHSANADPKFVDIDGSDNVLGYNTAGIGYDGGHDDNFILSAGSPAIDRGAGWINPLTDFLNQPRVDDPGTPNAGSPEYLPAVQATSQYALNGTAQNWRSNNSYFYNYKLPFNFPLYGTSYSNVLFISTEGFLQFAGPDYPGDPTNSDASLIRNARIAPLWDNIRTDAPGNDIYVDLSIPNQIQFTWLATNEADNSPVNFDVVLFSDGTIRFDYGAGNTNLTPTVGISMGDGIRDSFTTYDNASSLTNAKSILYSFVPGIVDQGAYEFQGNSNDTTPPTIVSTLPAAVQANGSTAAINQIQLNLSEPLNSIDAAAASNYELRIPGPDLAFGTADDVILPVTPHYTVGSTAVTLTLPSGAFALGSYRLRVFASAGKSIHDLSGNILDGDANGSPGGDYVRTFSVNSGVVVNGTNGNDIITLRLNAAGTQIQMWQNVPTTINPTATYPVASANPILVNTADGDDTLILDFTNGNFIPAAGITYDGGTQTSSDSLQIIGNGTNAGVYTPSAITPGSGVVTVDGKTINFTNLEPIAVSRFASMSLVTPNVDDVIQVGTSAGTTRIAGSSGGVNFESISFASTPIFKIDTATNDAGAGNDAIHIDASGAGATGLGVLKINAGTGNNTIVVDGGVSSLDASLGIGGDNVALTLNNNAVVIFAATQRFAAIALHNSSHLNMVAGKSAVLEIKSLVIDAGATLDLADNDLILHSSAATRNADLAILNALLKSARNNGAWNAPGLASSSAASEPNHLTGLAIALNDKGSGTPIYSTFDGVAVDANSVLIKYTYNGDADLNGKIDADDYFQIDNGFAQKLTGYRNGDFDFNGSVDADDYFLIDRAFVGQTGVLAASQPAASAITGLAHTGRHRRAMHHRARR